LTGIFQLKIKVKLGRFSQGNLETWGKEWQGLFSHQSTVELAVFQKKTDWLRPVTRTM
jgi:hypothetical protein